MYLKRALISHPINAKALYEQYNEIVIFHRMNCLVSTSTNILLSPQIFLRTILKPFLDFIVLKWAWTVVCFQCRMWKDFLCNIIVKYYYNVVWSSILRRRLLFKIVRIWIHSISVKKEKKLKSMALVCYRTIPTVRPPLVRKISATFCG
jgi:hypothetical protein